MSTGKLKGRREDYDLDGVVHRDRKKEGMC